MKKGRIVAGIIGGIIIGVAIYWVIPYSPVKAGFDKDIKARLAAVEANDAVCTQEEIDKLPEPLKNYCEYIGLVGSKKRSVVNAVFGDTSFILDDNSPRKVDMDYDLWLFADKPYRSAYCRSALYGVPFDGMDYCTDNKEGGMKGMIGKAIEIFDTHNEQMYVAGMISWLAESAAVNPSALLSPYVSYEEIDATHVKATISYNGIEGTGIFAFDENGLISSFESDQRQVEEINGVATPIGWRGEFGSLREYEGIKIPTSMRAIKEYPDREVVYFDSSQIELQYY